MISRLKKSAAIVGAFVMIGTFTAPTVAAPPAPEYAPMATLTANKPTKAGKNITYSASAGSSTTLKASLRWQLTGPDQTLNSTSKVGTYVSGNRICDWGTPRERILYTRANSSAGQVDSTTLWTTSNGSSC